MIEVKSGIREFILVQFPAAKKIALKDDQSLLTSGIVDSLGVLELVNHLVDVYGIEIDEEDLMPENFESIEAMAQFVMKKRNGGP